MPCTPDWRRARHQYRCHGDTWDRMDAWDGDRYRPIEFPSQVALAGSCGDFLCWITLQQPGDALLDLGEKAAHLVLKVHDLRVIALDALDVQTHILGQIRMERDE